MFQKLLVLNSLFLKRAKDQVKCDKTSLHLMWASPKIVRRLTTITFNIVFSNPIINRAAAMNFIQAMAIPRVIEGLLKERGLL